MVFVRLSQRQLVKRLKDKTQEELVEMEKYLMSVLNEEGNGRLTRNTRPSCSERVGSRSFCGEQENMLDYYRQLLCAVKTELSNRVSEKGLGE